MSFVCQCGEMSCHLFESNIVCCVQSGLSHEELSVAVEMLSAVAVLNEVLDTKDTQAVIEQLTDSPMGFTNMDQDNLNRSVNRQTIGSCNAK